ncbi:pyridoxamine 5'-phosphate oxidase family protein [Magnetovibrio sp. PR-2]|uniref:pyridoxamine 5'-phosphate oxidase family protein n=1 Tax=Magnetovibrio sp. PR-2 TaxID=3120356 RepID=UPI002FCE2794
MTQVLNKTERTRLRRAHPRGHYDVETIHAILDAQPMCHLAYVVDGSPICMPTIQWREGGRVYWHASSAGRGIQAALGAEVCLTVSILDGLILARSAMHHSVNFRSVLVFGQPEAIEDPDVKKEKLGNLIDHLYPGRNEFLRPMTDQEIKATAVLSMPIDEASAKIRTGGPKDDEADYALPIWAGVLPVSMSVGEAIPDPRNLDGVERPKHLDAVKLG